MKFIPFFIAVFCVFQTVTTKQLRNAYKTASDSEKDAAVFIELTNHIDSSALHRAYLGAAFALKAKFENEKIKNLREAKKRIEDAVNQKPQNIEIRMIRLSIQESLPGIAGYGKAIDEDKAFIIENLKACGNQSLKKYLQGFVKHSKSFNPEEKALLLKL